jgi:hypothetical protein
MRQSFIINLDCAPVNSGVRCLPVVKRSENTAPEKAGAAGELIV